MPFLVGLPNSGCHPRAGIGREAPGGGAGEPTCNEGTTEESTDRRWERNWGVIWLSEALSHTVLEVAMPWHFQ